MNKPGQVVLDNKLEDVRHKLIKCLDKLGCVYELPSDLQEEVNEDSVSDIRKGAFETASGSETQSTSTAIPEVQPTKPTSSLSEVERTKEEEELERLKREEKAERARIEYEAELKRQRKEELNRQREFELNRQREFEKNQEIEKQRLAREDEERRKMTDLKAQKELLDIVNGQIKRPYDGEPLGLPTFLTGVEIAKSFASTEDLRSKLVTFVKGRLEGRARELISEDIETIDDLVDTLKDAIKPENSNIIEARIAALHYSYSKQEEFAKRTEELADALRRTLIIEGMTPQKANEITIQRTVKLCSKSTTSDVVKAVLRASTFTTAKEVVAKLITGNDECVKEKQVLRYQKDNGKFNQTRGKFRGRGYQNQRGGRGSYNNSYNSNQGRFNNYRRGGYRGRGGNGRGNYNNGYNNNRYQSPQNNNGNWRVNQN